MKSCIFGHEMQWLWSCNMLIVVINSWLWSLFSLLWMSKFVQWSSNWLNFGSFWYSGNDLCEECARVFTEFTANTIKKTALLGDSALRRAPATSYTCCFWCLHVKKNLQSQYLHNISFDENHKFCSRNISRLRNSCSVKWGRDRYTPLWPNVRGWMVRNA